MARNKSTRLIVENAEHCGPRVRIMYKYEVLAQLHKAKSREYANLRLHLAESVAAPPRAACGQPSVQVSEESVTRVSRIFRHKREAR